MFSRFPKSISMQLNRHLNYNIPKITANEANKKHFFNLETEENEATN